MKHLSIVMMTKHNQPQNDNGRKKEQKKAW